MSLGGWWLAHLWLFWREQKNLPAVTESYRLYIGTGSAKWTAQISIQCCALLFLRPTIILLPPPHLLYSSTVRVMVSEGEASIDQIG